MKLVEMKAGLVMDGVMLSTTMKLADLMLVTAAQLIAMRM
jgi:hypothetical protein